MEEASIDKLAERLGALESVDMSEHFEQFIAEAYLIIEEIVAGFAMKQEIHVDPATIVDFLAPRYDSRMSAALEAFCEGLKSIANLLLDHKITLLHDPDDREGNAQIFKEELETAVFELRELMVGVAELPMNTMDLVLREHFAGKVKKAVTVH